MEVFRIQIGSGHSKRTLVVTGDYVQQFPFWRFIKGMRTRDEALFFLDAFEIFDHTGDVTATLSNVEIDACSNALHSRVIRKKRSVEKATRRLYLEFRTKENMERRRKRAARGSAVTKSRPSDSKRSNSQATTQNPTRI